MDFYQGKALGRDLNPGSEQTRMVGDGYDHCFVIDRPRAGARQSICAWATCDESSISMKVYTPSRGSTSTTGNFLQDCPSPGKGLHPMQKYGGFALETEHFPCSPSHPEFPLHHPAGGQGVPGFQHPSVLHRQTVRRHLRLLFAPPAPLAGGLVFVRGKFALIVH